MAFIRPDIIRPPSEARSYFLPLTAGCSNNTCGFCNYYGYQLRTRPSAEVKQEIDALAAYLQHGLRTTEMPDMVYAIADEWDGKRIFLQDGDALVYPYEQLEEALQHLNARFPALERIACYATAPDILRRSPAELETLRKLKLGIVYMGVESGSDEILREIGKGFDSEQIVAAGKRATAAGITLSVTVILGLGGVEKSAAHALATAQILTRLDPEFAGALTLTLIPGTPLFEKNRRGEFQLISPLQSLQELKLIIENAKFSGCFFSSMHASNYFSVRGKLPQEKNQMLSRLDYVLARQDPALLRPEFLRGL